MEVAFVYRWCQWYGLSKEVYEWLEGGGHIDSIALRHVRFTDIQQSALCMGDQCMLRGAILQYRNKAVRISVEKSILRSILQDFPHLYAEEEEEQQDGKDTQAVQTQHRASNSKKTKKSGKNLSDVEPPTGVKLETQIEGLEQRLRKLPWIKEWERYAGWQRRQQKSQKRKTGQWKNNGASLADQILAKRQQSKDKEESTPASNTQIVEKVDEEAHQLSDEEVMRYTPDEKRLMAELLSNPAESESQADGACSTRSTSSHELRDLVSSSESGTSTPVKEALTPIN